ncbi:TPA: hypothetical protein ACH3X1_007778 [Trebouxia sp. C0004]
MDFDNLQQVKGFSGHNAYSVSKLANLMFSNQLAPMLRHRGITVNCVHPGIIATNVLHAGWGGGGSDAKGADDVFNLATGDAVGQQTGKFFAGHGVMQQPAVAEDSSARILWRSRQVLNIACQDLHDHGCSPCKPTQHDKLQPDSQDITYNVLAPAYCVVGPMRVGKAHFLLFVPAASLLH